MTNRLKSSQLKYLSIGYFRKYIKLPVLLFTFLIINPNKDGLFEGDFFRGGGEEAVNLTLPSYFKKH